jgi:hypothetical protein
VDTSDQIAARLPKQFLITGKPIELPTGWKSLRVGDRYLFTSPELPTTPVIHSGRETDPRETFLVLGWFAVAGQFFPNQQEPVLRTDVPIERLYHDMTGRFIILCADRAGLRCMTDPGALLPLVYRPASDEAASTPAVLSMTAAVTKSNTEVDSFQRVDPATWYPFGVTPFSGIHRALPGSVLQLPSGETEAISRPRCPTLGKRDIVERIQLLTRRFVEAVSSCGTIECHLTAGWDSRMVLSACLGTAADTQYLTYKTPGTNGGVDCHIARRISRAHSLPHKDTVMNLTTTVVDTYTDRYALCGLAGEVGRAFYWRANDIGKSGLSASMLLSRLGFIESKPAIELAERWLSGQAGKPTPAILDQAYIDLRLGGWAGPSLYGHPVSKPTLSPFNNATIFTLMRALPEDYRYSGQFARDFVALESPTLARIPVNRAAGMNRLRYMRREITALLPKSVKSTLRTLAAR